MAQSLTRRRIFAPRRSGAILLMIVLCLALASIAYRELMAPADEVQTVSRFSAPASQRAALPKPDDAAFALPPIETYAEVTERPLFSPTRRPPPPEAIPENIGNAGNFVLLGIVISDGSQTALIQHGRPPTLARLAEGQALEGWTVQSISANSVTLQNAGTQHTLKLKDLKERPAASAVTPRQPRN